MKKIKLPDEITKKMKINVTDFFKSNTDQHSKLVNRVSFRDSELIITCSWCGGCCWRRLSCRCGEGFYTGCCWFDSGCLLGCVVWWCWGGCSCCSDCSSLPCCSCDSIDTGHSTCISPTRRPSDLIVVVVVDSSIRRLVWLLVPVCHSDGWSIDHSLLTIRCSRSGSSHLLCWLSADRFSIRRAGHW